MKTKDKRVLTTDPFSNLISVQGAISVGNVFNIILEDEANEFPGDYAYRSGLLRCDVELGMWGIFRILRSRTSKLEVINDNYP